MVVAEDNEVGESEEDKAREAGEDDGIVKLDETQVPIMKQKRLFKLNFQSYASALDKLYELKIKAKIPCMWNGFLKLYKEKGMALPDRWYMCLVDDAVSTRAIFSSILVIMLLKRK
ncbi:hypothetical protein SELMODRAFT_431108 [Selaginella moellendorffii]|uniref:Uncharacterized protein n=1 Tax=Selaginella moellendorffii TaxID=88036 RepID=D8TBJ5_SELML|nr:hypothetical protein SELMODRAFT_431108 [Selaginella moellendorffii]